jgi:hypothetical protein
MAAGVVAVLFTVGQAFAQECNYTIAATAPDSRYTDHGDGTVTDNSTGLMWRQCSEGRSGPRCLSGPVQLFTWQAALQQAEASTFAGYSDWRLPNVKELASLMELRCVGPAINLTLFPATPPHGRYWSSTPEPSACDLYVEQQGVVGFVYSVMGVDFYRGEVTDFLIRFFQGEEGLLFPKDLNHAVRLVRGGE